MVRPGIGAGLIVLLAGCGGQPPAGNGTAVSSSAAGVEVTAPGATARQGADGSVTIEGSGAAVTLNAAGCDHPDFAPLYSDAVVNTCVGDRQDPSETRGSVIYTTAAPPAAVLAWSKERAAGSGLALDFENEMTISASEGKRMLTVMAMPQGSGSAVTVNWGEQR